MRKPRKTTKKVSRRSSPGLIPSMISGLTKVKDRLTRMPEIDWPLFGLCLLSSLIGIVAIFSAGMTGSTAFGVPRDAFKQCMWLVAGIIAFIFTAGCRGEGIQKWTRGLLIGAAVLVLLTFVPGLGKTENSQTLWLDLKVVSLQPAELLKYAALMGVALSFAKMSERPIWRGMDGYSSFPHLLEKYIGPLIKHNSPVLLGFTCAGLVLAQQDMATASVILVATLGMMVVSGVPSMQVVRLVGVMAALALVFAMTAGYRMSRIQNWINRYDPAIINHGGFQQTRSELAIAKGGWTGRGLVQGTIKKSLPTPTSDFVMATVGEETGVLGVWAIIGIMAAICLRMLHLAERASGMGRMVCTGAGVWIAAQTAINVAMVNAWIPAVGLPMPFITYGGSSLIVLWILVGAVTALSVRVKEEESVASDSDGWGHGRTRFSRT